MLEARNIGVTLGRRPILHGVDVTARAGEVTAIVGPNGSGKTTLLRALTRDIAATGEVWMNGENISRLPSHKLALMRGVLPQATPLAFPFAAIEVVRLGLQAGIDAANPHRAAEALERVGLLHKAARLYQELSGGEQQRVQLARVLAQISSPVRDGTPCWLFLDEPVASLDIGQQLAVMDIARDFARQGGGVVTVMHDLNLSAMYAERIVLVSGGRIAGQGAPDEILCDHNLQQAYGCALRVNTAPVAGRWLLPHSARIG